MDAFIHTLYESDFYRVLDFKCQCKDCRTSKPEYSDAFCISFVRKGNFIFNVFRHALDSYNGCVLITKPEYERTVTHVHAIPDECTIIEFKAGFYTALLSQYRGVKFLFDPDLHSTLVKAGSDIEFLHFQIMNIVTAKTGSKLQTDHFVMELIERALKAISDHQPDHRINAGLKKHHLQTIETAKQYMLHHFVQDISLMEIATHCCVSPFHFSRIFKTFTSYSPHQFLLHIRLKNAEVQLKSTTLPVSDIAFASGFNSIEHFTNAFSNKYHCSPTSFRMKNGQWI